MNNFVHFWAAKDIPFGVFSNWARSDFSIEDGTKFANNEQYFMYRKALLFDKSAVNAILLEKNPMKVKKLGRLVKNFDEKIWNDHRIDAMKDGLRFKFADPHRRKILISTGNKILCESSPRDKIWGTGLAASHADANYPDKWPGLNLLGKCLMDIRKEIVDGIC